MREKLIELIREGERKVVISDLMTPDDQKEAIYSQLADHLIANSVTVQEWISVKDRLPEHKGNYLGFTGSTTMVGYYKGNGIWWVWLNDVEGENLFTHWMPLPQPPKGE